MLSRTANSIRVRVRVRVPVPVASDPYQSIKGLTLGSLFITTVPRVFLPSCRRQVHPLPRGRRAALPFRRVEVALAAVSTALQQRASHPPACATSSSSLFSSRLPPHHLSTHSLSLAPLRVFPGATSPPAARAVRALWHSLAAAASLQCNQ